MPSKHVVIVEDDEQLLGLLECWLTDAGYDVVACVRFADAKTYLANHTPDILLTDLRLGAYNGLQLALLVREVHPDVAVVVLSGYDDPVLRKEAAQYGARYLRKPITSEDLLRHLDEATPPSAALGV
jgi:DNA-binding response OmpR family regulator